MYDGSAGNDGGDDGRNGDSRDEGNDGDAGDLSLYQITFKIFYYSYGAGSLNIRDSPPR